MRLNGPRSLVKRAAFSARFLGIENEEFEVFFVYGQETYCLKLDDGKYLIVVDEGWRHLGLIGPVAHEMTHLRQYHLGHLVDEDDDQCNWKGDQYADSLPETDEYFLAPWEMEARAMETFIEARWEER